MKRWYYYSPPEYDECAAWAKAESREEAIRLLREVDAEDKRRAGSPDWNGPFRPPYVKLADPDQSRSIEAAIKTGAVEPHSTPGTYVTGV